MHAFTEDLQEDPGCHADRQRTLRELEVGRTLFKEGGRWVIKHQAGDYKTGRAYGQRPPMIIAPHIYPEVRGPRARLPRNCGRLRLRGDVMRPTPGNDLDSHALYS